MKTQTVKAYRVRYANVTYCVHKFLFFIPERVEEIDYDLNGGASGQLYATHKDAQAALWDMQAELRKQLWVALKALGDIEAAGD